MKHSKRFGLVLALGAAVALGACGSDGGDDGSGGGGGTGGTGGSGDFCTAPEPNATLGGSCVVMGFCYEVRGGTPADWAAGCAELEGTWSGGACAESYKGAGGACETGVFGTTVTYYYGSLDAATVQASCAETQCAEYVAP